MQQPELELVSEPALPGAQEQPVTADSAELTWFEMQMYVRWPFVDAPVPVKVKAQVKLPAPVKVPVKASLVTLF